MNLISIESSTDLCSVSSFKKGNLYNVIDLVDSKEHSKNLPHIILRAMNDFEDYSKIEAFAVSIGPGSFTSVRIALSIVKGLAFGLKNNIIPVSTLEAMNYSVNDKGIHYVSINSFKNKCFIQKFKGSVILDPPFIFNIEDIGNLDDKVYLYSNNAIEQNCHLISPSSISLAEYAIINYSRLVKKYNDDISPIYLSENKFVKINDNKSK